ncbi:MAG TPA: hypothetical protein VHO06_17420 [Polyangia bacterium]|nr:hypothetical protein [Polyangia bacterium]
MSTSLRGAKASLRLLLGENDALVSLHALGGLQAVEQMFVMNDVSLPTCEIDWLTARVTVTDGPPR